MQINFFGTDINFLENAFVENATGDNLVDVSFSPTQIVGLNTLTNYRSIVSGFGFALDGDGFLTSGTVTGMTFVQNNVTQASIVNLSWTLADFGTVLNVDENTDANALLQSIGINDITLNAATAGVAIDLSDLDILPAEELADFFLPFTFIGSVFDDTFLGAGGNDTIDGRAGNDTFLVGQLRGDTTITAITGGFEITSADGGTDRVLNMETFDFLGGEIAAADVLSITGDVLRGDEFANTMTGSNGEDTMNAEGGNDVVNSGAGDDNVKGAGGNDTLKGGNGKDTVSGDGGSDAIYGGNDNDTLKGGGGDDSLKGGKGKDTLQGNNGRDTLEGGGANDKLSGGKGKDDLSGGAGNDTLTGGKGNDTLRGGPDQDTFVFDLGHDKDVIEGLNLTDDVLQISVGLAGGLDAQGIEDAAELKNNGNVKIDFGNGDVITLNGLGTTDGLAEIISIV